MSRLRHVTVTGVSEDFVRFLTQLGRGNSFRGAHTYPGLCSHENFTNLMKRSNYSFELDKQFKV